LKYIVGTRGSKLSLAQTNWVLSKLIEKNPETEFEIKSIKTKGDSDARPLFIINQKGIFEKEIDTAVENGVVDFAVHSLKDVPSEISPNLVIACVPTREIVNDVLVTKNGTTLESMKTGTTIGTSSLRRAVQISRIRPDINVKPVRGNIETRIRKIEEGLYDGVILAQAGITRLGLTVNYSRLSLVDFPPSPGQGALAIISHKKNNEIISLLKTIEDANSRLEIESERALSKIVESGCRFPVGAFGKIKDNVLQLIVVAYSVDGKKSIIIEKRGKTDEPTNLGVSAGQELKTQGVDELAINWRQKVEEWNKS